MKTTTLALLISLALSSTPTLGAEEGGDARKPDGSFVYTNRLAKEKSPYLVQHAHNPVDWYPWGAEAFEKAKKEDKPIFLSIGYSTCHWCHVMERESFSNPEVAKLINDNFVPIKVDREERPDVDRVYMAFLQGTTGGGGWPMTVFLTSELKPFFAGTYFPPEDHDGSPGLKTVLTRVHEVWGKEHEKIITFSDAVAKEMRANAAAAPKQEGALDAGTLLAGQQSFATQFDAEYGGLGRGTKFPQPVDLDFLLHCHARTGDRGPLDMVLKTLRAMAAGGIHDHLGGGFHRYSTDRRWFLPHFEKMLYDQAQLACVYLDAYRITHDEFFADTARDILEYVLRDMTGPEGQFYSAEDADSATDPKEPEKRGEGAFYVWKADDIEKLLGGDAAAIVDFHFGVEPGGNVVADPRGEFPGKNVLYLAHTIEETAKKFGKTETQVRQILADARARLLEVRNHRIRPRRDDKALCAWNGLMISAFARGGRVLNEPRYTAAAERAARFAQAKFYNATDHKLVRSFLAGPADIDGFLEDYAYLIRGFIDLYENANDIVWLKLALDLQASQDTRFWEPKAGGYYLTPESDATLLVRQKDESDSAEPAGNSIACLNLLRLGRMTDDAAMNERAAKTLAYFSERVAHAPASSAAMLVALDFRLDKPQQVIIAGKLAAPDTEAMFREIASRYMPNRVVLFADGGEGQAFLAAKVSLMRDIKPLDGKATAFVCENFTCQLPVNEVAKLRELLEKSAATQPATTRPAAQTRPSAAADPDSKRESRVFVGTGSARRIVFCSDCSGSMINTMPAIKNELTLAIAGLEPTQSFEIIFFQDSKYDSFMRFAHKEELVPATPDAKREAGKFLEGVTATGATDPIPGIEGAFKAKPQLIYLLTDGDFPDNAAVLKLTRDLNKDNNPKVRINTIAFVGNSEHDAAFLELFKTIAKESGGTFKHVKESDL